MGYFGPEEALLRSPTAQGLEYFQGCQAGKYVLGIESQRDVKGCPSLQSQAYVGGNLRQQSLCELWEQSAPLAFRRQPPALWGFCQTCPFSQTCQGGCSFTAHALFGRPGNNPYCHFQAPGQPFDHALFELLEEPLHAPDPGAAERPLRQIFVSDSSQVRSAPAL